MQVEESSEPIRIPTAGDVAALEYPTFEWPEEGGFFASILSVYKHAVTCLVQQLRMWEYRWAANIMGALLWEPIKAIQSGMNLSQGKEKEFHPYGINPTELSDEQKRSTPILALHGKNGTQGSFITMAQAFQKAGVGPLFTLNLCEGELTMEDKDRIDAKIFEIQRLYGREIQVDLIGYSRGAEMALYMGLEADSWHIKEGGYCYQDKKWNVMNPLIGRIFRIGSMTIESEWNLLSEEIRERIYEVRGTEDILMPEKSLAHHQIEVYEGHVGLVDSPEVHTWLISQLS